MILNKHEWYRRLRGGNWVYDSCSNSWFEYDKYTIDQEIFTNTYDKCDYALRYCGGKPRMRIRANVGNSIEYVNRYNAPLKPSLSKYYIHCEREWLELR